MLRFTTLLWLALLPACTRLGNLGDGLGDVLTKDARRIAPEGAAAPGPHPVTAQGRHVGDWEDGFPIVLYRPADVTGPQPAIIFLPGRSAPEQFYESWGRALASRGFVVAMRGYYGFFRTDPELKVDARKIADWLVKEQVADPQRMGITGHSMGGKTSIMVALEDPRFRAVVALDPDENGYTHVARGPIANLRAPLLVIGMEYAIRAHSRLCATEKGNYRFFWEHAPPGTMELTVAGADHMQVMDDSDYPGMGICRVGTNDSVRVRTLARAASVSFFERHLLGKESAFPVAVDLRLRVKGDTSTATATR
jgi:dienelactone hydrolase